MDDEFFEAETIPQQEQQPAQQADHEPLDQEFQQPEEPQVEQPAQQYVPPQHNLMQAEQLDDDEFNFDYSNQPTQNTNQFQMNSFPNEDDERTKKIREEEERILAQLRDKADRQYELKKARKEKGHQELEQFIEKKATETDQRKRENQEKQNQKANSGQNVDQVAGWKKVGDNVELKIGDYPGSKNIARMREAIIHKREDQQQ